MNLHTLLDRPKLNKIRQLSRWLRFSFIGLFCIYLLIQVLFWLQAPSLLHLGPLQISMLSPTMLTNPLNWSTKIFCFVISLIPISLFLLMTRFIIYLCRLYEQGIIFTRANSQYLKKIGLTLLIIQFVEMTIYPALISLAISWENGPGLLKMSLSTSGINVGLIIVSLFIILIAWIMSEASKLHDEQQLTI